MADNPPPTPPPNPGPRPTLPLTGSGLTGRLKNPTTRLPIRTGGGGKIVVMLSSVAKAPPAGTQALPRVGLLVEPAAPTPAPPESAATVSQAPPPLPPKQVTPAKELPSPSRPQLSATTYVKLPPKTAAPGWTSLSGKSLAPPSATPAPASNAAPPPKVAELVRSGEAKKVGAQHIPPIKLNEPVAAPESTAAESIFLQKQTPAPTAPPPSAVPKAPMPATTTAPMMRPEPPAPVTPAEARILPIAPAPVTPSPATPPSISPPAKVAEGVPVSLDLFERTQTLEAKATPVPAPDAKEKPTPLKAPPLMPPNLATPPPATGGGLRPVRPPPMPPTLTKPMGSVLTPPAAAAKLETPVESPAEILLPVIGTKVEKKAESSVVAPPPLPKLEKAPDPVVEKAPPAKLVEAPAAGAPTLLIAPIVERIPERVAAKLPPPLPPPLPKPVESPVVSSPVLHVAPPMLEKAPEPLAEKLPQPLLNLVEAPAALIPVLHVAPPPLEKAPEPVVTKLPPPLAKPVEAPVIPGPLHVAPPMLEKAPEPAAEKLPQPHLPVADARQADAPAGSPGIAPTPAPMQKAPAMIPSEKTAPKPSQPPKKRRSITSWLKKTTPLVVSSSSAKVPPAPIAEAKPALKAPALPSRSLLVPASIVEPRVEALKVPDAPKVENTKPAEEARASENVAPTAVPPISGIEKTTQAPAIVPALEAVAVAPAAIAAALAADKKKSKGKFKDKPAAKADSTPPRLPPEAKTTAVPLTRAERAKKRRIFGLIFFWAFLFPATVGVLFWASLHFGRDTRVEGQVIPPPGTVLSNEVWIVTDFRSLASGITEDLAAERTPLMQEITEREDHVRGAQGDVATREERIRLIQEEMAAHKAEIESIVKQARDATQQVWDVEGAAVDDEYASRMHALKNTIADRAKSLNLTYQPDSTYDSPEVWANAYRLALYEVPKGVDGVKEHQWLSDQMTQWRAYQKSADDRKEALREKAAQIKLGPAPKITDLNAKIDELQQRIDATEAEEVPLKAELQQAQADLVTAQSADVGLDDKYYKQLYSLPGESVIKRIPLQTNGRFSWPDDNVFLQGEDQHSYYVFARATRADGRQYWSLGRISIQKDHVSPILFEPSSFISTKAILRPTLSPEEIEQ